MAQAGGEEAVQAVGRGGVEAAVRVDQATGRLGQQGTGGVDGEVGVAFTEAGHGLLVFLGFERAGGVDEHPARFEQAGGDGEQLQLVVLVGFQVFGLTVPADVRLAADDAGARAGGIDEDGIKGRRMAGGLVAQIGTDRDH